MPLHRRGGCLHIGVLVDWVAQGPVLAVTERRQDKLSQPTARGQGPSLLANVLRGTIVGP